MKVKVNILDNNYNTKMEDNNLIVSIASKRIENPTTITPKSAKFMDKDDKDQDELLEKYNKILRDNIKS